MPPEELEKVFLHFMVLLALSVFMLLIARNLPDTLFYIALTGEYQVWGLIGELAALVNC